MESLDIVVSSQEVATSSSKLFNVGKEFKGGGGEKNDKMVGKRDFGAALDCRCDATEPHV